MDDSNSQMFASGYFSHNFTDQQNQNQNHTHFASLRVFNLSPGHKKGISLELNLLLLDNLCNIQQ